MSVLGLGEEKTAVTSLLLPGWRCPSVGENVRFGMVGNWNLMLSVSEWFVIVKHSWALSWTGKTPNWRWFSLAAEKREICITVYL